MKAQFKYSFRAGMSVRGPAFLIIFVMDLVFITLGALGLLPFAAQVTAVSLGGTAIAVMICFIVVNDGSMIRRMFSAPGAYLYALTPAPRRQILLASVITMMVLDVVMLAAVIFCEVLLSFNLSGLSFGPMLWSAISSNASAYLYMFITIATLLAGYLALMMILLFVVTVRTSVLYSKPAGGLLTVLLALVTAYVWSLTTFILAPFGTVGRYGIFFTITLNVPGLVAFPLLLLVEAAALFIVTSKLLERKVNI